MKKKPCNCKDKKDGCSGCDWGVSFTALQTSYPEVAEKYQELHAKFVIELKRHGIKNYDLIQIGIPGGPPCGPPPRKPC